MTIAVTGPESSGKTTLSRALSDEMNGVYVPEFARTYLSLFGAKYNLSDVRNMARGQQFWMEQQKQKHPNKYIISDTDLSVFYVWTAIKYGTVPIEIKALFWENLPDLYLLCKPDIPWEYDPLREHPTQRDALFLEYIHLLEKTGVPCEVVDGNHNVRMEKALFSIKKTLKQTN